MNRTEMRYLLDEEVFTVYNRQVTAINANNNGILNDAMLEREKRMMLKASIEYLTDELVKVKKSYPTSDISDVKMSVDCVVMDRKTFDKIKTYINV